MPPRFGMVFSISLIAGALTPHCPLLSKRLGHSMFALTLDGYGDYIPEEDGGAANNLPEPPALVACSR